MLMVDRLWQILTDLCNNSETIDNKNIGEMLEYVLFISSYVQVKFRHVEKAYFLLIHLKVHILECAKFQGLDPTFRGCSSVLFSMSPF
jgi:hypothetical protein